MGDEGAVFRRTFGKSDRLLRRADFLRVSEEGKTAKSRLFIGVYVLNHRDNNRLGITVTKKTGGAVTRNRIKRQIREFFRRNRELLATTVDLNIIARREAAVADHARITESLQVLFKRISNDIDH